jgi:hypothetical protein
MKKTISTALAALALISGLAAFAPATASAQVYGPVYSTWQPAWDRFEYDRHHVILGTVAHFSPYRVSIQRPDGMVQTVDLKNGTVIRPTGATPRPGDRIAAYGYYSNGTFVVNGLILR